MGSLIGAHTTMLESTTACLYLVQGDLLYPATVEKAKINAEHYTANEAPVPGLDGGGRLFLFICQAVGIDLDTLPVGLDSYTLPPT